MDRGMIERIDKALATPYCVLRLRADGHDLSARVQRTSEKRMTYGVWVYVDGWIKGENLKVESEIGAKFYPLHQRQLMSKKYYADYAKAFGKRKAEKLRQSLVHRYRSAFFRSGRALALHLKKHCQSVEIVEASISSREEYP